MHYSNGIGTLSIILLLVPESFADPALLVDQGQPRGCIFLSAALTDKRVFTAAHELAGYLEQMSGARAPVQRDDKPGDGFRILIDSTKLAAPFTTPASISAEKVGLDGFIIRSVPNGVAIAGHTDLATANGIYHFSEEVLGGHWFSPEDDGPTFPKRTTIEIPQLDITVKPDFWWRWYKGHARLFFASVRADAAYASGSDACRLDATAEMHLVTLLHLPKSMAKMVLAVADVLLVIVFMASSCTGCGTVKR